MIRSYFQFAFAAFFAVGALLAAENELPPEADDSVSMMPGARAPLLNASVASEYALALDPGEEWVSEAVQKRLAKTWISILEGELETPEIRSSGLQVRLVEELSDGPWMAFRGEPTSVDVALADAILSWKAPWDSGAPPRGAAKVVGVEPAPNGFRTRILTQLAGTSREGLVEVDFTIVLDWLLEDEASEPVLIGSQGVEDFTEARFDSERRPLFADRTGAVFSGRKVFTENLRHGLDYWRHRVEAPWGAGIVSESGIAVGDANGDGWDDVFVPRPEGLPCALLVQQPDGSVEDVAALSGLNLLEPCRSALFLDLDNDGDQDLVVGVDRGILAFENLGDLRFERRTRAPFSSKIDSLAAADYDGDGRVDVYVCGHTPSGAEHSASVLGAPRPIYDARNGQPNQLLRNVGSFRFLDTTLASGLALENNRFSYAASWEDYDNDGDPDLYVANDFGRNQLFRNDGSGVFEEVSQTAGVEDIASGMSVSWGDYNADGWMDLYVGNMFSSAGERIAYQRQFREGANPDELAAIRRMARGNTLFENNGDGTFRDVSVEAGVTMGRWAWSSLFVDFNGDGWEDILIANGFVSNERLDDL